MSERVGGDFVRKGDVGRERLREKDEKDARERERERERAETGVNTIDSC